MRKIMMLALSALLLAGVPLAQAETIDEPSVGGWTSGNIEWVRNVLISQDGVGGRVVGDYFYANDQNKIMIFDWSQRRSSATASVSSTSVPPARSKKPATSSPTAPRPEPSPG